MAGQLRVFIYVKNNYYLTIMYNLTINKITFLREFECEFETGTNYEETKNPM